MYYFRNTVCIKSTFQAADGIPSSAQLETVLSTRESSCVWVLISLCTCFHMLISQVAFTNVLLFGFCFFFFFRSIRGKEKYGVFWRVREVVGIDIKKIVKVPSNGT